MDRKSTQGLLCLLAADVAMLIADGVAGASGAMAMTAPLVLGAVRLALLSAALLFIRFYSDERSVSVTMVAAVGFHLFSAVMLGHWRGQPDTALITAVAVTIGTSVLLPWGGHFQAILVAGVLVMFAVSRLVSDDPASPLLLMVLGVAAMLTSPYLSLELSRTRKQLAARLVEESAARAEADQMTMRLEAMILERTASLAATAAEFESLCYSASHDLRPPLRTIAGYCEILRESALTKERAPRVHHLDHVIGLARAMGARIDDLLRLVRATHRSISESLISLAEVARSEQECLFTRDSSCRWVIDDGAGAGSSALADHLRSILRFVSSARETSVPGKIEFGRDDAQAPPAYFVRAGGVGIDADGRRTIAQGLAGVVPFAQVPPELVEVVATARTLATASGGKAWLEDGSSDEVTFWFHGSNDERAGALS